MINTEKGGQTGGVALVLHNLVTRSEQFKHKLKVKEIRHPQPQAASCSLSPRPRLPLLFQAFADPKNTFFPNSVAALGHAVLPRVLSRSVSFGELSLIFQNSAQAQHL